MPRYIVNDALENVGCRSGLEGTKVGGWAKRVVGKVVYTTLMILAFSS
jgi:hypothetical protein